MPRGDMRRSVVVTLDDRARARLASGHLIYCPAPHRIGRGHGDAVDVLLIAAEFSYLLVDRKPNQADRGHQRVLHRAPPLLRFGHPLQTRRPRRPEHRRQTGRQIITMARPPAPSALPAYRTFHITPGKSISAASILTLARRVVYGYGRHTLHREPPSRLDLRRASAC